MITWMQRHKKYLIVTIWISTISFVGAGFVGWGQYSYGDKAGAIAKVGDIEVTQGELQQNYAQLYAQYNAMFQGNFDEEQAKNFGLQRQAFQQLQQQALLLNLAKYYDITISTQELLAKLVTQQFFFKNGSFDKETYKQVLSKNNLSLAEYEADLKKQLTIEKLFKLFPIKTNKNEKQIFNTLLNIADKMELQILDENNITVDKSENKLKAFWETKKDNYMTEVSYKVEYFTQPTLSLSYKEDKIASFYAENKTHFKDDEGKILSLASAKQQVISELNDKSTKNQALRNYIDYKKARLDKNITLKQEIISKSNNPFSAEALEKITKLSATTSILKPIKIQNTYVVIKLIKTIPSRTKTFQEAKEELLPFYITTTKKQLLLEMAKKSLDTFQGSKTDFITMQDTDKIKQLTTAETQDFLTQLFNMKQKTGFITLNNNKVILYRILEQKLLDVEHNNLNDSIVKLKNTLFHEALMKKLQTKYNTEIFIEGL